MSKLDRWETRICGTQWWKYRLQEFNTSVPFWLELNRYFSQFQNIWIDMNIILHRGGILHDLCRLCADSFRGNRQSLLQCKPLCSLRLYDLVISTCWSMEQDIKPKHQLCQWTVNLKWEQEEFELRVNLYSQLVKVIFDGRMCLWSAAMSSRYSMTCSDIRASLSLRAQEA